MITFISKSHDVSGGCRRLEYDVNITITPAKTQNSRPSVRVGFRNHCADRIQDDEIAFAFDDEQKKMYIIPKRTIPKGLEDTVKCYTVCNHKTSGCCAKTSSPLLYEFVIKNNFTGHHNMELDAQTGWYVISAE